jgi:hypothetical protein
VLQHLSDAHIRFVFAGLLYRNGLVDWDEFTDDVKAAYGADAGDQVVAILDRGWRHQQ